MAKKLSRAEREELVRECAVRMARFKAGDKSMGASAKQPWGPTQPMIDRLGERWPGLTKLMVEAHELSKLIREVRGDRVLWLEPNGV